MLRTSARYLKLAIQLNKKLAQVTCKFLYDNRSCHACELTPFNLVIQTASSPTCCFARPLDRAAANQANKEGNGSH
jgi:hypothetical protein